jgi:betaine-aldehyde dehydrogenase
MSCYLQPLLQICWKLGPALATGNAVIIKPSEVTPLSTIFLVRKILLDPSVGIPSGAIQLLTAGGGSVGSTLTTHPEVDLVSFTGGLSTGRKIIASCAETVKRCCVELGGKNPNVVFADVDLDWAADTVATAVFLHSGQVCSSGARLIVEERIADKLVAKVVEKAKNIRMGNGLDPESETGPLVSKEHLEKIKAFVELGKREGAKMLCGGAQPDPKQFPHLAKGCFFLPTVFDHCNREMRIVQEETFGPILTVERFKDGDEETAIKLANDTKYGLAGGVQSRDTKRAERVAKKLRHGTVWINTYGSYTAAAEWGGFGLSGNGRELGSKGLDEYIETKHTWTETQPAPVGWFKSKL